MLLLDRQFDLRGRFNGLLNYNKRSPHVTVKFTIEE
jgi:hypothetical protein